MEVIIGYEFQHECTGYYLVDLIHGANRNNILIPYLPMFKLTTTHCCFHWLCFNCSDSVVFICCFVFTLLWFKSTKKYQTVGTAVTSNGKIATKNPERQSIPLTHIYMYAHLSLLSPDTSIQSDRNRPINEMVRWCLVNAFTLL